MKDFLKEMARSSCERSNAARSREPFAALRERALGAPPPLPIRNGSSFELIAEYKRRSPSRGALVSKGTYPGRRVEAYARGGAAAVSVLTEPTYFDGRLEQLAECAALLAPHGVPVLRKDFLVDPYQVCEARAAGAGGVLLIMRILSDAQLAEMRDCAREMGLFVLLELFDATDIARAAKACRPNAAGEAPLLVGLNCRDLETLETVPARLAEFAAALPRGCTRVAESGLGTPADCAGAARAGYGMALVGGALMSAADPESVVRSMLEAGRAAA